MREIKFRAWNGQRFIFESWDIEDLMSGVLQFNENLIFMPYTGLKDKNGKEIYEGDIICNPDAEIPEDKGWEVRFNIGSWECVNIRLRLEDGTIDTFHLHDFGISSFEVIGNIHENPDLI